MDPETVRAPDSQDTRREAAEVVSEEQFFEACAEASIARSKAETVRELPALKGRICTPPPRGLSLTQYSFIACRR